MLKKIIQFFENNTAIIQENNTEQQLQLVTAALFIEMMLADDNISNHEKMAVKHAIKSCFNMGDNEVEQLVSLAEEELKDATDYYQFTQLINQNFNQTQKIKIIENLWEIAYADSQLDDLEEHMVRKISELIYVPHTQFIKSKLKVIDRLKKQTIS